MIENQESANNFVYLKSLYQNNLIWNQLQFIYLNPAACCSVLLCVPFLLRKETFFTANRWFLLAGLVTSVVLPLVVLLK
jgi:hypothetical protein